MAEVVNVDGQPVGCHRTYITRDGGKAGVTPDKASLGPIWGGAVRLFPAGPQQEEPYDGDFLLPDVVVVGEGIESSASAGLLMGIPAWAALSAGNLSKGLILPGSVRFVVIAADHDPITRAGQLAADTAAARWRAEGLAVRICTPDRPGADFNDVLLERPLD